MNWPLGFAVLFLLFGCGQSPLKSQFISASQVQSDLNQGKLDLWARSPNVDGNSSAITFSFDLDKIQRTSLFFSNVDDVLTDIGNADLKIMYSKSKRKAPAFFSAVGKRISATSDDFLAYTSFYHLNEAMSESESIFASVGLRSKFRSAGIYPLTAYVAQPGLSTGEALAKTGYYPGERAIYLYKQSMGSEAFYAVAHEADAIYHEFGHAVQHALNASLIVPPVGTNPDVDAILEGLADYFAATMLKDDKILRYLSANANSLFDSTSRLGKLHNRSADNTLVMSDAFMDEAHLDGRILSGALNDIRKLLSGKEVSLLDCTVTGSETCKRQLSTGTLSSDNAWKKTLLLSHRALEDITISSSFHAYGKAVLARFTTENVAYTEPVSAILVQRGVIANIRDTTAAKNLVDFDASRTLTAGTNSSTNDVHFGTTLGFYPFPNAPAIANGNSTVERCEAILIYPRFKNNTVNMESVTNTKLADLFRVTVTLNDVTGFSEVAFPNTSIPVDPLDDQTERLANTKIFGYIPANDSTFSDTNNLVSNASSPWYQRQGDSFFTNPIEAIVSNGGQSVSCVRSALGGRKPISDCWYPSDVGWLVEAPTLAETPVSTTFKVTLQPYNALTITKKLENISIQQSLSVSLSSGDFCEQE